MLGLYAHVRSYVHDPHSWSESDFDMVSERFSLTARLSILWASYKETEMLDPFVQVSTS